MQVLRLALPATLSLLLLAPQSFGQTRAQEEANEKTVELSQVPKPALDAAKTALGTTPTEARTVSGTNPPQYELEAKDKSGKEVSVHVRADGTVIKREKE
jgi:hypothetical protein